MRMPIHVSSIKGWRPKRARLTNRPLSSYTSTCPQSGLWWKISMAMTIIVITNGIFGSNILYFVIIVPMMYPLCDDIAMQVRLRFEQYCWKVETTIGNDKQGAIDGKSIMLCLEGEQIQLGGGMIQMCPHLIYSPLWASTCYKAHQRWIWIYKFKSQKVAMINSGLSKNGKF